jgi:hypothetical protein
MNKFFNQKLQFNIGDIVFVRAKNGMKWPGKIFKAKSTLIGFIYKILFYKKPYIIYATANCILPF